MVEGPRIRPTSMEVRKLHFLISEKGACKNHKEIFKAASSEDLVAAERSIRVCENECTMQRQCLEFAIANREQYGVWGGVLFDVSKSRTRRTRIMVASARLGLKEGANNKGKERRNTSK